MFISLVLLQIVGFLVTLVGAHAQGTSSRSAGQEAGPLSGPTTRLSRTRDEVGEDELYRVVSCSTLRYSEGPVRGGARSGRLSAGFRQLAQLDRRRRRSNLGLFEVLALRAIGFRCWAATGPTVAVRDISLEAAS